jgi:PPM family protein phosphatase
MLQRMLNLFKKEDSACDTADSSDFSDSIEVKFEVDGAVKSDQGCIRTSNEDSIEWITIHDPYNKQSQGTLVVVADGMGGHAAGEIASSMAVDIIRNSYHSFTSNPQEMLKDAFYLANKSIFDVAQQQNYQGMGTTCTALLLLPGGALCAHVGDSRLYLVRGQRIFQLSEDDSLVAEMVRRGAISAQEARTHDQRNVILRALGTQPVVDIAIWPRLFPVKMDDTFVVCTDGLTDLVDDNEICQIVSTLRPDAACTQLIDLALSRGGADNVTVGVFKVNGSCFDEESTDRSTREHKVV